MDIAFAMSAKVSIASSVTFFRHPSVRKGSRRCLSLSALASVSEERLREAAP
jgi:hypothetical protein